MAENPQQTQTITTADLPEPAPDATTGTPTAPTSTMTTATSAAGTGAMNGDVPPTGGGAGTDGENLQPAAPENGAVGADQQPVAGANLNEINGTWCDLSRLSKATLAAAIVAGNALAGAERELGDGLDAFITTRTPWNLAEARADRVRGAGRLATGGIDARGCRGAGEAAGGHGGVGRIVHGGGGTSQ